MPKVLPPIKKGLLAGLDIGGTKVQIADTGNQRIRHFITNDYPNIQAVLEKYFAETEARPEKIVIAVAGPRNDETGVVQATNFSWPDIEPQKLAKEYPGTNFITTHDLAAAAAGALLGSNIGILELKTGESAKNGPVITVTIGTGLGVCAAIWDHHSKRRIFFSGEAGHMGFMPYNKAERRHLEHLYKKFDHPSAELAVNGKHGIDGWLEHSPELKLAHKLKEALARAQAANRPSGAVLLEFATEGEGSNQQAAHQILDNIGSLVGNILADYALIYRATGGIYLTGSVCMGLGEYWAQNTNFSKVFVRHGSPDHAQWLEGMLSQIPIYLLTDPDIASKGALALAQES